MPGILQRRVFGANVDPGIEDDRNTDEQAMNGELLHTTLPTNTTTGSA